VTPTEIMTIALRRAGLTITSSAFSDNARDYMNIQMAEIGASTEWQWSETEATLTTVSGTKTYSLSSNVYAPISFRNSTDNFPMAVQNSAWLDTADANQSDTGSPATIIPIGINATTGYWEVMMHPTPNDSTTSIPYRYNKIIPLFTADGASSTIQDSASLAPYMPINIQHALIYGVSQMYHAEKGDYEGEDRERRNKTNSIDASLTIEGRAFANQRIRFNRSIDTLGRFGAYNPPVLQ